MAYATRASGASHSAAGDTPGGGLAKRGSFGNGELKITQDVMPSGLALMPRGWALRIAHVARRLTSRHA